MNRSISEKLPLAVIWMMAIGVPLAIVPGSYNSALIKLLIITVSAGLLLLLLGVRMLRNSSLPENLPILLLLLISSVTALHVYAPSNPGVTRILLVSSAIAIFISLRTFRISREKVMIPLLAGGSLAILVTFFQPSSSQRLAGVFTNANLLGSFAAGLLPAGIAMLFGRGWKKLSLLILFTSICGTALFMSGTRSSILALAGGTTAVLLLRWRPKLLNLFVLVFLVAVVSMVFLPRLPLPEIGGTPGVRQVIWEGTSNMFFQKPVFGWGNGSFQLQFPGFRPSDFSMRGVSTNTVHAHSEPLEILAEGGVIGFLLWSALITVLLKQAMSRNKKTLLEWGVITGIAVLLLEGLTSVALRWTTSVYLLTMLFSLMPVENQITMKRLPRIVAILPLAIGLLLLLPGSYKVYRMTRSSILLKSATTVLAAGDTEGTVPDLCMESIRYNTWELGSWYTLGNYYGQEVNSAEDVQSAVNLLEKQLASYDSLAVRSEDYAWMRWNRIDACLKLGLFDRAMDDVIYLYRHRANLKDSCLDIGYSITPLASPGRSFELLNLVFLEVLAENMDPDSTDTGMRTGRMESSILTTFALASVYAPDAVNGMRHTADSLLSLIYCGDVLKSRLMASIEIELQSAVNGHDLLERYHAGDFDGLEHECREVLSRENTYAVFHRAVMCLLAAENGNTEFMDMSAENAIVLAEPCYPLVSYYPGAGEVFISAASLAQVSGDRNHLLQYFRYACEIDSYGIGVMNSFMNCYANQPSREVLSFWYENGGPQASVAMVSPTGLLAPHGEIRKLLQLESAESPEFRVAAHLILSSLAISTPGVDVEYIATTASLRLQSQHAVIAEMYGSDEAERIITGIMNRETDYLENHLSNRDAASFARELKSIYESWSP